jgi:predicted transcriptional regulator
MMAVTKDEAQIIAGKVNDLVINCFLHDTLMMPEDIEKLTGLTTEKSTNILNQLVKKKILKKDKDAYGPNPKMIEQFKGMMEELERRNGKKNNERKDSH